MREIRIGKDILVRWSVLTNGQALPHAGRDLKLECHMANHTTQEVLFARSGNAIEFVIRGRDQSRTGKYSFTLWENFGKDGQMVVDCCDAFCLVRTTREEVGGDAENLTTETVDFITADMQILTGNIPGQIAENNIWIHTKKINTSSGNQYDFHTVIEGVSDADLEELSDPDKYRLVLMNERKHQYEGRRWRIPMLPYEQAKRTGQNVCSMIAEADTWWPVTGRIVPWFRDGRKLDQAVSMEIVKSGVGVRFCSTRNIIHRIGVGLFKRTNKAGEGWTRISNIAYVELYLSARKSEKPYVGVTVRS